MPVHDWTRVDAGIFHDFHQAWTIGIRNALNGGALPPGFFAMAEQVIAGPIPDVITLQRRTAGADVPERAGGGAGSGSGSGSGSGAGGAVAVADAPPRARFITAADPDVYAGRANRITVRHRLGQVVAVIEIVSPGNKSTRYALRAFVEKAAELLRQGIHLLVIDVLPPSSRDPQGIHKAVWDTIREEPFELPPGKPLTVAAYAAGEPTTAYVEPLAVGEPLPSLPVFLDPGRYVPAPLEITYQATWDTCPEPVRELLVIPQ